jgi:hypothetical protein
MQIFNNSVYNICMPASVKLFVWAALIGLVIWLGPYAFAVYDLINW